MNPTIEKPKHIYQAPAFIDDEFIKTLSPEKQAYWAQRKTGAKVKQNLSKIFKTPDDIVIGFDNDGHMVAKTRAMRRRKLPTPNIHTKATHSIKKARAKRKNK